MIFYGLSDVGLHRENNQDSFGYLKIAENAEIFVVCDGMGGANGGNIASEMAARVFTEYLGNALGQFVSPDTGMLDLPEDTDALGPLAETTEFFGVGSDAKSGGSDDAGAADGAGRSDVGTSDKEDSDGVKSDGVNAISDGGSDESDGDTDAVGGESNGAGGETSDGDAADSQTADGKTADGDDTVTEFSPEQPLPHVVESLLADAVSAANDAVYERASKEKKLRGMGTTVVAALTVGNKLYIASVGDSRIYLFCGGDMVQLTRDHSYVQYLIDMGQITSEEALTNPYRNVITRAVGNEKTVETDTSSMTLTEVPTYILLCSDGLTGYVDADDIRDTVWGYGSDAVGEDDAEEELRIKTEQLINRANEGGGGDNITALLIKYVGQDAEREKETANG